MSCYCGSDSVLEWAHSWKSESCVTFRVLQDLLQPAEQKTLLNRITFDLGFFFKLRWNICFSFFHYFKWLPLNSCWFETCLRFWLFLHFFVVFKAKLVQDLGLSHQMCVLNSMALFAELRAPRSSESVRVIDMSFSGVQARVFESTAPGPRRLKPGVVYFHGGGWALGSARECDSL